MQNRHLYLAFDHLAVTAPDLSAGLAHAKAALGQALAPGGAHPAMGTHNHLMALGPAEYLEVIAPDPAAPAPPHPRWFGLDHPRPPRLATWIARVADLDAALAAAPVNAGRAMAMSRGDLSWRIAVRDDGTPPLGGAFPTLIEWPDIPHPAGGMADAGFRLARLEIESPDAARFADWLTVHLDDPRIALTDASAVRLTAHLDSPAGAVALT